MPDLPKKKVGIVSCSGEEMPEGTVTRLATLKVLWELRPDETVTICLPLFLAGGKGERTFARYYPTIAVDGCERRCAAKGTEMYSGKPAASIVVRDLTAGDELGSPEGKGRLNERGKAAVEATAARVTTLVDELRAGRPRQRATASSGAQLPPVESQLPSRTACSCTSTLPSSVISVDGEKVSILGLPLISERFLDSGKVVSEEVGRELLKAARMYNFISPEKETAYAGALLRAYEVFCASRRMSR